MLTRFACICALLTATAAWSACGGSSPTPAPTPAPAPIVTITIANGAVSPQNVTIARGSTVTFVNNDSRSHDIESNPHPAHTDCPEINQVGNLEVGQRKTTGAFPTARACGFHDHSNSRDTGLQGMITIQ